MAVVGAPRSSDPPAVELLQAPLLRRQVWLHPPTAPSKPLVYATSWWNAAVRVVHCYSCCNYYSCCNHRLLLGG